MKYIAKGIHRTKVNTMQSHYKWEKTQIQKDQNKNMLLKEEPSLQTFTKITIVGNTVLYIGNSLREQNLNVLTKNINKCEMMDVSIM